MVYLVLMYMPITLLAVSAPSTEGPGSILLDDVPRRLAGVQRGLDPFDVQKWRDCHI